MQSWWFEPAGDIYSQAVHETNIMILNLVVVFAADRMASCVGAQCVCEVFQKSNIGLFAHGNVYNR